MLHSEYRHDSYAPFAAVVVREEWPVLVALPALCAAVVLAVASVGWLALALAGAIYAVGYRSFVTARSAHATYAELVQALGRIGELNGAVSPGHSVRTADLAVEIGRRLGLGAQPLATVRAAAMVRSAGLAGREDPPHYRPGFDHETVVRWSQSIVGRAGRLDEVAALLDHDAAGVLGDVVGVAATYDEAVNSMGMSPEAALALVCRETPPAEAAVTAALAAALVDRGHELAGSMLHRRAALTVDAVAK